MNATDWIMLSVAIVIALVTSLLITAEAALTACTVGRAQALIDEDKAGSQRVVALCEDKAPYLNAVLLLRLLLETAATTLVAFVVFSHLQVLWQQLVVTIAVMTLVSFLLWGVASRTLGRQHPGGVLRVMAVPMTIIMKILNPLVLLLILIGNAVTPGKGFTEGPFTTEAELRDFIDIAESNAIIEDDERRMIHSVFELGDTIVREVMVPRTDIVYVEADKTLRQGISLALRSGFSRIPVVGDNGIDDVVGVMFLKDCMRRVHDNEQSQMTEDVASVMREVVWVPDSKPVDELLQEMQRNRTHLAIVSDEFGGVAGIVTIEDILEEIVGEIIDEYDQDLDEVIQLDHDSYRVSSRMSIDDLGELFDREIDDDDVETVGGLLAKQLGMVPLAGSEVTWEGLNFTVERSTGRRKNQRTILVHRAPVVADDNEKDTDND
ncbi:MAG: hemolysin family protein [Propionibacteriaceae bacterium]